MKKTLSTAARVIIPFLLGAGMLYWMYRGSSWSEISEMLFSRMTWSWMLVSLAFGIVPQVLRGWRWRLALEPMNERPRRTTCVWAIFVSYAASLVVPRIGEITRCGTLKRYEATPFAKSLGTVVSERVVDALFMLAVTVFTLISQRHIFATFFDYTGTSFESIFGRFSATGYVVAAGMAAAVVALVVVAVRKLEMLGRVRLLFRDLWEGIVSLRHMRSFTLYMFYSIAIWYCYYLHFSFTLWCFDFTESLGAFDALVLFCAGSYAVLIPTPNGAGPWHFAVKTMLILYGVTAGNAILFALVVHAMQTALIIVLGIFGLTALQFTRRRAAVPASDATDATSDTSDATSDTAAPASPAPRA